MFKGNNSQAMRVRVGPQTRWVATQLGKGALQAFGALVIYAIATLIIVRMFRKSATVQSVTNDAIRYRAPVLANNLSKIEDQTST